MKKKNIAMLATVAAAGIYSFANGKGIFNKVRFRDQHDSVSRYVKSHYPNAAYSPITAAGNGWTTVIRRVGKPRIFLYITRSNDNTYIFHETDIKQ